MRMLHDVFLNEIGINHFTEESRALSQYGSDQETAAVLLPGFAIN